MPKRTDYQYWLYDYKHDNVGSFLDFLSDVVRRNDLRMNVLMVTSQMNLEQELRNWLPEKFELEITNSEPIFSITVTKTFGEEKKVTARAVVVKYQEPVPVYLVISDSNSNDFKNVIAKLLSKHYPIVSRVFLTNNEMRIIFDKLEETTGFDMYVDSSIGKKRLVGTRKKESQVTYTNMHYADVFDEIVAHDRWVQSIRYTAEEIKQMEDGTKTRIPKFSGVVSRECFFSCRKDFQPLIQTIIPLAIKLASVRYNYLKIRAESASRPKPEPVVITFPQEIFSDISKNKQYVDALLELESSSLSSYHTNPYLHLSMIDYLDGSSYDLWVLSSNRLIIIPQFSASTASMSRLVNHIFERIHEGEVEDYGKIKINAESQ